MGMLTEQEAQRIALCVNALRPDWATNGLMTVLHDPRCRNRVPRDLTLAFVAMALDPQSRRPGRIFEAGPWWQVARPVGAAVSYRTIGDDDCATCFQPLNNHPADHPYEPQHAHATGVPPTPEQREALAVAARDAEAARPVSPPKREPRDPNEVIQSHLEETA